jgi:hypothetical protein
MKEGQERFCQECQGSGIVERDPFRGMNLRVSKSRGNGYGHAATAKELCDGTNVSREMRSLVDFGGSVKISISFVLLLDWLSGSFSRNDLMFDLR